MHCYCCENEVSLTRKVKLRPHVEFTPEPGRSRYDSVDQIPGFAFYQKQTTYRDAFICLECYRTLDNECGMAEIMGHESFNIAGASRGDKAPVYNEKKYQDWQRKQAEKMGIDS